MQSITVIQLQKMILAFCSHIITQKARINSINVFPVPDQDTGSNLASTLEKVRFELRKSKFKTMKELSNAVKETALYSAQGNSGIIYTGFLIGFFELLCSEKSSIGSRSIYKAFKKGAKKAYLSIEIPQNGTILDVMDAVTAKMGSISKNKNSTVEELFKHGFIDGQKALEKTREKMLLLRDTDVVDAGGLAFVMMLESFYETLTGKKLSIDEEHTTSHLTNKSSSITKNKIEVVFILEDSLMSQDEMQEMLSPLGDSLDIISVGKSMKAHIHTDKPGTVKEIAFSLGTITFLQIMDMQKEVVLELLDTAKRYG